MKKIILYPGAFNPVTKGHRMVMESAINSIDADMGLFFITPNDALMRKMVFKSGSSFVLSEEVRKSMIESLSFDNNKLLYGGREIGGSSPSTVRTINSLFRKYKNSEIYLLMGADKLHNLPKWSDIDTIIDKIHIIVAVRDGFNIDDEFDKSNWLSNYKDRFIIIKPSPEAFEISSSQIRNRFYNNQDYSDLMDTVPYSIFSSIDKSEFAPLTDQKLIEYEIKYNGRYGPSNARKLIFKLNSKLFHNWDESVLGNKENKLKNTKVYKNKFVVECPNNYNTITGCLNADCVDVAKQLIDEGYNPAILNLASNVSPGGGYHKGTSAQEESLCQMSTLSQSLYQFGSLKYKHIRDANLPNITGVYPMDINFGGIYSPDVTFFRNNFSKLYTLRDDVFSCPVITVASLSNRIKNEYTNDERKYFNSNGALTEEGSIIESNKIRTIFRIALDNGHDSVVLGAFGCGVYNLLSSEVSKLFFDILNESEFKNKFKKLVFAIYEGKSSSRKITGSKGKFKPFYEWFE